MAVQIFFIFGNKGRKLVHCFYRTVTLEQSFVKISVGRVADLLLQPPKLLVHEGIGRDIRNSEGVCMLFLT